MTDTKRLFRRSSAGRVAGVCAGIAEYLDTDVTLIRLLWIVLSIVPGSIVGGLIAYAAAWIIMPDREGLPAPASGRRLMRSERNRKLAGVCGGFAEYLDVDPTIVRVLGVIAYLVAWFIIPSEGVAQMTEVPRMA
jgi:phage shock protein C